MKLTIRQCRDTDVSELDKRHPSPSIYSFHASRYAEQRAGVATYLIAFHRKIPVGHSLIKWTGCDDAIIRSRYTRCPEINGLDVFGEDMRSRGIGTQLIHASERLAKKAGYSQIGLGVDHKNHRAKSLYLRLGYTGDANYLYRYSCTDSLGTRHVFADPCVFLTKSLNHETVPWWKYHKIPKK